MGLIDCGDARAHEYPDHLPACPYCRQKKTRQESIEPPVVRQRFLTPWRTFVLALFIAALLVVVALALAANSGAFAASAALAQSPALIMATGADPGTTGLAWNDWGQGGEDNAARAGAKTAHGECGCGVTSRIEIEQTQRRFRNEFLW